MTMTVRAVAAMTMTRPSSAVALVDRLPSTRNPKMICLTMTHHLLALRLVPPHLLVVRHRSLMTTRRRNPGVVRLRQMKTPRPVAVPRLMRNPGVVLPSRKTLHVDERQ